MLWGTIISWKNIGFNPDNPISGLMYVSCDEVATMRPERYAKWGCHQPSRVGMSFYGISILINVDIIRYQSSLPLSPETFLKTIVEGRNSSKHHFRSPKWACNHSWPYYHGNRIHHLVQNPFGASLWFIPHVWLIWLLREKLHFLERNPSCLAVPN